MTRRRIESDPVLWIIFVVAIAVPSIEFARLRATRETPRPAVAEAPRVVPAGKPRVEPVAPPPMLPGPPALPAAPPSPRPPKTSVRSAPESASAYVRAIPPPRRFLSEEPTATPISAAVLSPRGDLAAVLEESGRVTVWDVDVRKQISSFLVDRPAPTNGYRPSPPMALMAGSMAKSMLAIVGWDAQVHVWEAASGTKLFTSPPDAGDPARARSVTPRVVDVVWSGPVYATTLTFDGGLANWMVTQPAESALVSRPPSPDGAIGDVDANVDRGLIAVASRGGLYLLTIPAAGGWKLVDSAATATASYPVRVQLSHDGGHVASVWSTGDVRIHSTVTREKIRGMGYGIAPSLLAFSRDGKLLAVGGPGHNISVWQVAPTIDFPIHLTTPNRRPLRAMWFAPNGRGLVVVEDGERYLREIEVP